MVIKFYLPGNMAPCNPPVLGWSIQKPSFVTILQSYSVWTGKSPNCHASYISM